MASVSTMGLVVYFERVLHAGRGPAACAHVQNCRENDDGNNGLQTFQHQLQRDVRHTVQKQQKCNGKPQTQRIRAHEQHYNICDAQYDFGARVHMVQR